MLTYELTCLSRIFSSPSPCGQASVSELLVPRPAAEPERIMFMHVFCHHQQVLERMVSMQEPDKPVQGLELPVALPRSLSG